MEVIMLTCPTCGARVEVTQDIDRFACLHCGNEMLVIRRGGTASLRPVLEQVRDGAVRTASELAIKRLDDEVRELMKQRSPLAAAADDSAGILWALMGGIAAVVGVLIYVQDHDLLCCAAPIVIVGIALVALLPNLRSRAADAEPKLQRLDALIDKKQHELRSHKETVELDETQ